MCKPEKIWKEDTSDQGAAKVKQLFLSSADLFKGNVVPFL